MALTFDDARSGVYRHAHDLLREHGFRATVYVVGRWALGEPLSAAEAYSTAMTVAELRELAADGHELGYHSWEHRCYLTLDDAALIDDLTERRAELETDLGQPLRDLAYPFGHFDSRVERVVRSVEIFRSAVTNVREPGRHPFRLPRVSVKPWHLAGDIEALFVDETWRTLGPPECGHQT